MADQKTYTIQDLKGLLTGVLRKEMKAWEDVYVDLRKRELAKDDAGSHYEPGNHETPGTGVAPHMEPGTHESHSMGPGGLAVQPAQDPVGSDTGVPMNGQPANSTPGGAIGGNDACPMCNQPDLPGKCQCLSQPASTPDAGGMDVDGFDRPDAGLGADVALGGGALALSEKKLLHTGDERSSGALKAKVLHSETHPHGHYHVEDHGAGVHGVFYTSKRSVKPKYIATSSSVEGAKKRIAGHVTGEYGSHTGIHKDELDDVVHSLGGVASSVKRVSDYHEAQKKKATAPAKKAEPAPSWECKKCKQSAPNPGECKNCGAPGSSKKLLDKGEMGDDGGSSPVGMGMGDMGNTPGLAQSEMTHVCDAPLCGKGIKGSAQYCKAHKNLAKKPEEKPMKKDLASATADLKSKNQMLDSANKVRSTKPAFQQKFSKEEWIDIANEGDPVKRLKNFPDGTSETAVPSSVDDKGAKKRGQGVDIKTVPGATSEKYPVTKGVKKAEVPMAKPPSGQNMGTAVPKAKVVAPKLPGAGAGPGKLAPPAMPAAPKAPKLPGMGMGKAENGFSKPAPQPVKKTAMPAGKQMAMQASSDAHKAHAGSAAPAAPAVKLPGMAAQDQRAEMYSAFMPKPAAGPSVPGLKAPPKLPGMGLKAPPKPMFGKGEMEDLKCSMCKGSEHPGDCK